jgi:hypothetical protein
MSYTVETVDDLSYDWDVNGFNYLTCIHLASQNLLGPVLLLAVYLCIVTLPLTRCIQTPSHFAMLQPYSKINSLHTLHSESFQTPSPFPHFVTLHPYSKMD